jgi:hypothetical protein
VDGGSLTIAASAIASNQTMAGAAGLFGDPGYGDGGGLFNAGTLTVTGSTLSGNFGTFNNGGGISNYGNLTLTGSSLSGNAATEEGGGISNYGILTLTGSSVSGNSADTGGGISNHSTLMVSGSSLFNDSASQNGGGIYNIGTLTASNTTVAGNSATDNGGGIYNGTTRSVTLTNVTLAANQANAAGTTFHGGGLYVSAGSPVLHNTLIAGNFNGPAGAAADDVFGALNSGSDYDLIGDGTGMTGISDGVNGNRVGSHVSPIDAMLGPLQNNGGPTPTIALLPGSPAIDAGSNAYAAATDQRGFVRIVGGAIDIGAFEVQPAGQATHLSIQVPATIMAGAPFAITVTVLDDSGQTVTGYTGTVHFTLSGPLAMTANYTFMGTDMGSRTFNIPMLRRAGTYTVAGAATANPLISGNTNFTITPLTADHIAFNVPNTITVGGRVAITVTVQDVFGNTVTDFTDTVHFTLTGQVMAQANYTFTAADMGSRTFNVVFGQSGDYVLAGIDQAHPIIGGSISFTVSG